MRKKPKLRDVSLEDTRPLAEIDSERERLPASRVKLSAEERALLKDPDWIDEDEAGAIISERQMREEGHLAIPLEEYLKSRGRSVAD